MRSYKSNPASPVKTGAFYLGWRQWPYESLVFLKGAEAWADRSAMRRALGIPLALSIDRAALPRPGAESSWPPPPPRNKADGRAERRVPGYWSGRQPQHRSVGTPTTDRAERSQDTVGRTAEQEDARRTPTVQQRSLAAHPPTAAGLPASVGGERSAWARTLGPGCAWRLVHKAGHGEQAHPENDDGRH